MRLYGNTEQFVDTDHLYNEKCVKLNTEQAKEEERCQWKQKDMWVVLYFCSYFCKW